MAHERICKWCGTEYRYCAHCNEFNSQETWRYAYHDEVCRKLGNLWFAYRGNEISETKFKEELDKYPEILNKVFKLNTFAAGKIREMYGVHEPDEEKTDGLTKEEVEGSQSTNESNTKENRVDTEKISQKQYSKNTYRHNKK